MTGVSRRRVVTGVSPWRVVPEASIQGVYLLACFLQAVSSNNMTVNSGTELNSGMSSEKLLIQTLLKIYDKVGRNGRPVVNISTTVPVTFGLGLIQMDLDEKIKVLTVSSWTRYTWKDNYLRWNPAAYEGISAIRLDPTLVWIPDIMLYNTADVDVPSRQAQVIIAFDGTVSWYPHTIFRSSCSVNVANFPFDYQTCHMWFGSWTYSSKELDLSMAFEGGIDLSTFQTDYKESCAWDIVNTTSERKVLPAENVEPNFIVLTFEIFMRRKMVFSSYILTLPCVFLACITLVVFWLPPERPDRTSLAMSSFSSFMVLLLILVEACPATASSVPTLGIYYCFNMVIIMLSIILSSMVVNISRGAAYGVPKWMKMTVGCGIGRIVCIYGQAPASWRPRSSLSKRSKHRQDHAEMNPIHDVTADNGYVTDQVFKAAQPLPHSTYGGGVCCAATSSTVPCCRCLHASHCSLVDMGSQITEMRKAVQRIELKMDEDSHHKRLNKDIFMEWKYIAQVLDRFFFSVYVGLITVSLSVLFPRDS